MSSSFGDAEDGKSRSCWRYDCHAVFVESGTSGNYVQSDSTRRRVLSSLNNLIGSALSSSVIFAFIASSDGSELPLSIQFILE